MYLTNLKHNPANRKMKPANGFVSKYVELNVIRTDVNEMPSNSRFFHRKSHCANLRPAPIVKNSYGVSKYPFGKMKIGNSFFIPLFVMTREEQIRIRMCVYNSLKRHVRMGRLPVAFSVHSIYSIKEGIYGLAFFRVS